MTQKQKLFSKFFKTMIKMRKVLDETIDASDDSKVSTLLQMQALEQIEKHSQLTAGELASALNMSSSALTQLTDRMISAKLISRIDSKTDRRLVYLKLTNVGKKHFQKTMKSIESKTSKILEPIAEKDLKEVVRIFSEFLTKYEN